MITRDTVQGFLDGLKAMGHPMTDLEGIVKEWLAKHPTYPSDEATLQKIISDLGSYRLG